MKKWVHTRIQDGRYKIKNYGRYSRRFVVGQPAVWHIYVSSDAYEPELIHFFNKKLRPYGRRYAVILTPAPASSSSSWSFEILQVVLRLNLDFSSIKMSISHFYDTAHSSWQELDAKNKKILHIRQCSILLPSTRVFLPYNLYKFTWNLPSYLP